jgi:hypothetical protein
MLLIKFKKNAITIAHDRSEDNMQVEDEIVDAEGNSVSASESSSKDDNI